MSELTWEKKVILSPEKTYHLVPNTLNLYLVKSKLIVGVQMSGFLSDCVS